MNKLELKALQEAHRLLQSFEGYKFYRLVASTDNPELMREYEQLSQSEHSKVDQAKYWLDAVLSEQNNSN